VDCLAAGSTAVLEKLIVPQFVKKFPDFEENWKFTIVNV
jgi:hypothetical protein